jgi:hypothetical protein
MSLALNDNNLMLVNRLRNQALKASNNFDAIRFFAEDDYAKSTLVELMNSANAELRQLAIGARAALFPAPGEARPVRDLPIVPAAPAQDPTATQRFIAAKELMNSLVVDAAGLRSFFFVLKLEQCNTMGTLGKLMGGFEQTLAKGAGKVIASQVCERVRVLMA